MSYYCGLCKDDGLCRNNIKNKYYDEELFGETDYIDCWIYLRNVQPKKDDVKIWDIERKVWVKQKKQRRMIGVGSLSLIEE
jgi:hypothetical protein